MTTTAAPPDRERLLDSIRGIGHWRVRIIPESAEQRFELPTDCRDAVSNSSVLLRGWDYPHVPIKNDESRRSTRIQDGWEAMVNWDRHREVWRLMRSGQFIHYLSLWEDIARPQMGQSSDERVLVFEAAVFTLLEIVEFSRRLTAATNYGAGIKLEIDLADVHDRRLVAEDWRRSSPVKQAAAVSCVKLRRSLDLAELASEKRAIANGLAIELFRMFDADIAPSVIADIQEQLLQRR